jgi:hypothetical protein
MVMASRAFLVVVCHENGPTVALNTDLGLFLLARILSNTVIKRAQ